MAAPFVVIALAAVAVATGLGGAPATRFDERFRGFRPAHVVDDGEEFGRWRVVFDGHESRAGVVVGPRGLVLRPAAVDDPGRTAAGLVVSRRVFVAEGLHLNATWTTRAQTRVGAANPWEVGWLVWDYVDPEHFTYLVLKPNGWEVGRRDPAYPGGQRFVATGSEPVTSVGTERTATVDRVGRATTITVDGVGLTAFEVGPDETGGSVGMYAEDADVRWTRYYVATDEN